MSFVRSVQRRQVQVRRDVQGRTVRLSRSVLDEDGPRLRVGQEDVRQHVPVAAGELPEERHRRASQHGPVQRRQ
jgi:hypothetical protein